VAQTAVADSGDGRVALSALRARQPQSFFFMFRNAQAASRFPALLQDSQVSMSVKSDGQQARSSADAQPRACRRDDASDDR
jgi:hypothetical protein